MKTMITIAAALAFSTTALADDKMKKEAPKKEAPKAEAPPKPAQELVDMAKNVVGNWTCTGKFQMDPAKGWTDFKGTNKMTLDLDKFWLKGEGTMTAGPMKMKMTEFLTFDATQKKWYRV